MKKELLSVIIPVYNEEENLAIIYDKLSVIFDSIKNKYNYEIIFIDDGSDDNSYKIAKNISKSDKGVKLISLSRNFGHQSALIAGYENTTGDIIITLDCDMQDPVDIILKMLDKYEKGSSIVYAKRKTRNEGFFKKNTAIFYYKFHNKISNINIPENVGDFRLINKKVLIEFLKLPEKDKYIRGIFAWLGFKVDFVTFDRINRKNGETGYTLIKMLRLAMDGILSFSMYPLRIGMVIGMLMIITSFLFFSYMLFDFFIRNVPYPLFKWLSVFGLGFMGLQFIFIWIIGEYVGRTYNQVKGRPEYIINEKINFNEK